MKITPKLSHETMLAIVKRETSAFDWSAGSPMSNGFYSHDDEPDRDCSAEIINEIKALGWQCIRLTAPFYVKGFAFRKEGDITEFTDIYQSSRLKPHEPEEAEMLWNCIHKDLAGKGSEAIVEFRRTWPDSDKHIELRKAWEANRAPARCGGSSKMRPISGYDKALDNWEEPPVDNQPDVTCPRVVSSPAEPAENTVMNKYKVILHTNSNTMCVDQPFTVEADRYEAHVDTGFVVFYGENPQKPAMFASSQIKAILDITNDINTKIANFVSDEDLELLKQAKEIMKKAESVDKFTQGLAIGKTAAGGIIRGGALGSAYCGSR